jgi:hypothetical protein
VSEADNPYTAPQVPPEGQPPIPLAIWLRALVKGVVAGVGVFALAAGVATFTWVLCASWFGPPVAEREIARVGLLVCCVLVSTAIGAEVALRLVVRSTESCPGQEPAWAGTALPASPPAAALPQPKGDAGGHEPDGRAQKALVAQS